MVEAYGGTVAGKVERASFCKVSTVEASPTTHNGEGVFAKAYLLRWPVARYHSFSSYA